MRRVLLGLLGMMAAGGTCAEEYSFSALIQDTYPDQTIIQCDGPRSTGRVPKRCTLLERAIAYPNHQMPRGSAFAYPNPQMRRHSYGVACAAGHPIEFYPNGTLAECVLDAEQPVDVAGLGFQIPLGDCKGLVHFDKEGRVGC